MRFLSILFIAAFTSPVALSFSLIPEIGGDLISTGRIVTKLCLNKIDDTKAQAFFDCYNLAPGIEIFSACQLKVFGQLANTSANLSAFCKELYKFPLYATCLKSGFDEAKIDMRSTLDTVNKCEAEVLGL